MNLIKCCLGVLLVLLGCLSVSCGKLKLVAFKGPHGGFLGVKYRKPKLLGFKHHGFGGGFGHGLGHGFGHGFGHGLGGFGGGYHTSFHSSGGFGGWLGR
ncbi:keratin, type I cytoskeletal 15-like [Musca domestica]|uniref:Keratin, type I cytoskeletal 15 n=1 Tax=Musca domestica TaxID=7370 RepID=A0A1I8NDU9_MUSDO|nr:keratin, type I cytoskeletal 15 [Musca domestica]XP_058977014.1 keratin, type I cytoskeletal 15-like [Musca domestica]